MSVLIYGIDSEAKDFRTLTVSSEACFRNIWEPANDLSGAAEIYVSEENCADLDKCQKVYPI